jgi:predicted dehydrogenase
MTDCAASSAEPLRWGILSTAGIGCKNWRGMLASDAACLVGVASRDRGKAAAFIEKMQAEAPWPVTPRAFGSYQELIHCDEIDAVYLPLPTALRKEWVLRAARAGKHVLCEKPCAVDAADLREMIATCRENGVLFMDGVMFMHDPRLPRLREVLEDEGKVGEVRRISSAFSFRGGEGFAEANIRARVALEPAGCLGDLGWYCIRATLWVMKWELPRRVSGRILGTTRDPDSNESINDFTGEMDFAHGATANFHCSFLAPHQQWLHVSGVAGGVRVLDFVAPADDNDADWEAGYEREPRSLREMTHEARMFACFAKDARDPHASTKWEEMSWKTQLVQDACEGSAISGQPLFLDHGVYRARVTA